MIFPAREAITKIDVQAVAGCQPPTNDVREGYSLLRIAADHGGDRKNADTLSKRDLASVIEDLRGELLSAIEKGKDEQLRFELGPVELEVSIAVERVGGTSGKVSFKVVESSADHGKDTTTPTPQGPS
jgi:Trypsin-co-occurring domain 2